MASEKKLQPSAVESMFKGISLTGTKAGWCLKEGLEHVHKAHGGSLAPLIDQHGPPTFYCCMPSSPACRHSATQNMKNPLTCFESLSRTISGQSVSGQSAQAAWRRLLETTSNTITPERILSLVSSTPGVVEDALVVTNLQKPVGLALSKARSIVDLACHFRDGTLSEEFLSSSSQTEESIRQALLQVKGVGPWSCDMFLIFYLERPDILPLGDLGVRKGILKHFGIRGSLKNGEICPKKDAEMVQERLGKYRPYSSLLSYYMWRAVDVPLAIDAPTGKKEQDTAGEDVSKKVLPKKNAVPVPRTKRPRATDAEHLTTPTSTRVLRRRRVTP